MPFLVASLATYYLALSITREDGPFAVFLWLRNQFTGGNWVGRGLRCIVCMSCWTGLLFAILLGALGEIDVWALPVVWLGLAGASTILDRYWRR